MGKKKKKKKKRKAPEMPCDVPDCNREFDMGWVVPGKNYRVCNYHFKRHSNIDDDFSLFDVFKIKQLRVGVNCDRFGIPLPKDYDEMMERARKNEELDKKAKKEKSLSRLRDWRKNGGVSTRPKPRPTTKDEMDDAVGDILGG